MSTTDRKIHERYQPALEDVSVLKDPMLEFTELPLYRRANVRG